jgi:phage antirepressor YoqD-like protein
VENDINALVEAEVSRRLNDPSVLRGIILAIQEENESQKSLITNQQKVINEQQKTIDSGNETIKALIPVKEFYDAVTASDKWLEMAAAIKTLGIKGWGRNNVFAMLRDRDVFRYNNEPYQKFVERGYFKTVEEVFEDSYGRTGIYVKTMVSQKGLEFIRKLIMENAA